MKSASFFSSVKHKVSDLSGLQFYQLARYAGLILTGVCLAKLQVAQTEIGQFETFLMWSGAVSYFWVSGIINSMLSLVPKGEETEKGKVVFNSFILLLICSTITAFLFLIVSQLHLAKDLENGKLLALFIWLNTPAFLSEYILFLNGKKKGLWSYGVVNAFAQIAFAIVPILFWQSISYSFGGLALLGILRFLFLFYLLAKYAVFDLDWSFVQRHINLGLPIGLTLIIAGSAEYIDSLIINANFDKAAFSIFRYGAKEMPILLLVAATFSTGLIPTVTADLKDGMAAIKKGSTRLMHLFFPICMVLALVSKPLYVLVFNPQFAASAAIFNTLLLLTIPRLLFPQTILTAMKQNRYTLLSAIFELALNVVCSLLLCYRYGMIGVVYGTVIAYSFDKIFQLGVLYFKFGIHPKEFIPLKPFVLYSLLLIAMLIVSSFL